LVRGALVKLVAVALHKGKTVFEVRHDKREINSVSVPRILRNYQARKFLGVFLLLKMPTNLELECA